MSKEDDVVEEAVDVLSQEPVPEIKPYYYGDSYISFEDLNSIQKKYNFIVRQYLGNKFKAVIIKRDRNDCQVYFTVKHRMMFHWWSFTDRKPWQTPFFHLNFCSYHDNEGDFLNLIALLIRIFKTKEISA